MNRKKITHLLTLLLCIMLASCSDKSQNTINNDSIINHNGTINSPTINNDSTMIKVYVMPTCPDCKDIKALVGNNPNFQIIDIGEHVRNLKEFLRLRDTHPAFDPIRQKGSIGIPSFLKPDGTVTFNPEDLGLQAEQEASANSEQAPNANAEQTPSTKVKSEEPLSGSACNIDGTGC